MHRIISYNIINLFYNPIPNLRPKSRDHIHIRLGVRMQAPHSAVWVSHSDPCYGRPWLRRAVTK